MDSITLCIADLNIKICCCNDNLVLSDDRNYMEFLSFSEACDYVLQIHIADKKILEEVEGAKKSFSWENCWELYTNDNGDEFYKAIYHEPIDQERIRILKYNKETTVADLYISTKENEIYKYRYGELLLLFSLILERYGGIIVHATACHFEGYGGMIFCGKSGNGKSTLAKILDKYYGDRIKVMSDDRAILRVNDEKVFLYGSPWHSSSEYYLNYKTLLRNIWFIGHGKKNESNKVRGSKCIQYLICNSFCSFWYKACSCSYKIIGEIAQTVVAATFDFWPDSSAASYMENFVL